VKDNKKENVVSVPPASETPPRRDPLEWAQAHPLRGAVIVVFGVLFIRRAVRNLMKPRKRKRITFVADEPGSTAVESRSAFKGMRAVPIRHESNEEAMDLIGNKARKYVIVGGKGGVGKTSMSAAVATQLADRGQTTLIISTDPAHSLSDSFDQSVAGGRPVPVLGIDNLYAQEVNPENMQKNFRILSDTGGGTGMSGLDDMGLGDLNALFDTLPPGFDEAVALMEIIKFIEGDPEYRKFERIVFDTAPTGHTLRLLALPDFLNGFFGKIISMKSKFGRVMNQFKGVFGGQDVDSDLDASMNDIEDMKRSMAVVRDLFRDQVQTEFIVATIPNMMAIAESARLVDELRKEEIPVRHVFVNQIQPQNDDCTFCAARHKEQDANMRFIREQFQGLRISTVQSFDREIRGGPALRAMGAQLFPSKATQSTANESAQSSSSKPSAAASSLSSQTESVRPAVSAPVEIVE
jgi:arsenite/tail-anchored protein-transporting ATPase